jgi:hypothetical protein
VRPSRVWHLAGRGCCRVSPEAAAATQSGAPGLASHLEPCPPRAARPPATTRSLRSSPSGVFGFGPEDASLALLHSSFCINKDLAGTRIRLTAFGWSQSLRPAVIDRKGRTSRVRVTESSSPKEHGEASRPWLRRKHPSSLRLYPEFASRDALLLVSAFE